MERVKCVLLDIEGTTTPIDFVYRVLFPYARERAADFLARHASEDDFLRDLLARFAEEHARDKRCGQDPPELQSHTPEARLRSTVDYIHWLMDRDRKSTPLKELQGKIWEQGYREGQLNGQVFPDVPRAFRRWQRQHRSIAIYSSGSVLAQKLLFSYTTDGDLTPYIQNYFDTNTGAKAEPESYRKITEALRLSPPELLFISDVVAELDAARSAGVQTLLCLRPGNPPQPEAGQFSSAVGFDELFAEPPEGEDGDKK